MIPEMNCWQKFDSKEQMVFPWYTAPFLSVLETWEVSNWKVFEYGSGSSTLWWRKKAREVHSIDSSELWSNKVQSVFVCDKMEYIQYPLKLIDVESFDCIIIDGEPVEWRDQCTEFALQSIKSGGFIIIDNYTQKSVGLQDWPLTDKLLEKFDKSVFLQEGHDDWKTAYWWIKK